MTRVSGGREEGECWKILTNWLQFLVANDHHSPEIPFVAREKKDFSVHFFPRTMELIVDIFIIHVCGDSMVNFISI